MDENSFILVDANQCLSHKDKSLPETFRLRAWIINEGTFYNSYREDTGIKAENGLVFKDYPWNNNKFICDLTSYLSKEPSNGDKILIGVNLFVDGILTGAQGRTRFKQSLFLTENEASEKIDHSIKQYLSENNLEISEDSMNHASEKIKNDWLDIFTSYIVPDTFTSTRFESAIKEIIDKQKQQESLTIQSAKEQIEVLTDYIKELELEARNTKIKHQMEITNLQAQLSSKSSMNIKEWMCVTCTFFNPMNNSDCSMCGAKKS